MVCAVCSAARLSTPAPPEPLPHLYASANQLRSKNEDGADAFSAFTSVIRTLARNGGDQPLVDGLCGVFSGAPVHARST